MEKICAVKIAKLIVSKDQLSNSILFHSVSSPPLSSTLKHGVPPPLPPKVTVSMCISFYITLFLLVCFWNSYSYQPSQARSSSVSDEFGLSDGAQTVRRFTGSDNGPLPVSRRQSTPERGSNTEHTHSDGMSVSVSSPGLLSNTADHGNTHTLILQIMFIHRYCSCTTLI